MAADPERACGSLGAPVQALIFSIVFGSTVPPLDFAPRLFIEIRLSGAHGGRNLSEVALEAKPRRDRQGYGVIDLEKTPPMPGRAARQHAATYRAIDFLSRRPPKIFRVPAENS